MPTCAVRVVPGERLSWLLLSVICGWRVSTPLECRTLWAACVIKLLQLLWLLLSVLHLLYMLSLLLLLLLRLLLLWLMLWLWHLLWRLILLPLSLLLIGAPVFFEACLICVCCYLLHLRVVAAYGCVQALDKSVTLCSIALSFWWVVMRSVNWLPKQDQRCPLAFNYEPLPWHLVAVRLRTGCCWCGCWC